MSNILNTDIKYISILDDKIIYHLNKSYNIYTYNDLIKYYPIKYIDRRFCTQINLVTSINQFIQIKGIIIKKILFNNKKHSKKLVIYIKDKTAEIALIWFQGFNQINKLVKLHKEYLVFGKTNIYNGIISLIHPEIKSINNYDIDYRILSPLYKIKKKLSNIYITNNLLKKIQSILIKRIFNKIDETLPKYIIFKYKLMSLYNAFKNIHFPINEYLLKDAQYRLKFEELYFLHKNILLSKLQQNNIKSYSFNVVGKMFNDVYYKYLPFKLTYSQKKVIKEIRNDLKSGIQMNRLLHGDVGCGKTIVALMIMLIAIDNNTQTCLMVPTELLAQQHFLFIKKMLNKLPINIELLTGSTKQKDKKLIKKKLIKNDINILIGTHAILEDNIIFSNLGLAIIDEQHRFGVLQRSKLWNKNNVLSPHILIMSATPIPRTLAMTLYGNLSISMIESYPNNTRNIKTIHCYDNKRSEVFNFIKQEIDKGYQVYIVYPIIKCSEKFNLKSLLTEYNNIIKSSILSKYQISIIHGNMNYKEKIEAMNKFLNGQSDIMIATTAIEVGIDIPNASIILIENAEQFGLSQLHQLRGRIGRSNIKSYCILMTKNIISQKAKIRINAMVNLQNGFAISNIDLKLRGPGNFIGIEQSGIVQLKIANIVKDENIVEITRKAAFETINNFESDNSIIT